MACPSAVQILDALCHWVSEYHVDGFSFLNVQSLLVGPHGQPVARPLLVEALAFEPLLAGCKLIADPCSPISGVCGVRSPIHPLFCLPHLGCLSGI